MMHISSLHTAFSAVAPIPSSEQKPAPASRQNNPSQDFPQTSQDRIDLSIEGLEASRESSKKQKGEVSPGQTAEDTKSALTAEELKQLSQLKSRDREVRAHEQAHLSVAGQHAKGGASYTLERGPDGNSYAVGGEVPIDISSESTPEATIQKMQTIRRAALAPADPSGADRQIASQASAKESQARQEKAAELQTELSDLVTSDISARNTKDSPSLPAANAHSSGLPTHESTRKTMIAAYQRFTPLG
ncbi:MAG: putative metalloprotease CJM1_0395 family protein [Desulfoprunum sp.]|nr:putative metalloprotease CJM1_0395 family protein [Desulfoprunum sp.]